MYYKIVEIKKDGKVRTLFHGIKGSRILPAFCWLKAERKEVSDGTGKKTYMSGFHVFKKFEDAIHYTKKFRKKQWKAIVGCAAKGLRRKPTNKKVFLASQIALCYNTEWRYE